MQDAIIKGTGNSRYLKSVANFMALYPTYEDFVAALVSGTLPIDFNGLNPNGWTQLGTSMTKANVLTDATAALLGLTSAATPNDMLAALAATTPLSRGGTGQTSAAKGLYALINGATALAGTDLSSGDYLAVADISASTGKKITLQNILSWILDNGFEHIATGTSTSTYEKPYYAHNLSFNFNPKFLILFGSMQSSYSAASVTFWADITSVGVTFAEYFGSISNPSRTASANVTVLDDGKSIKIKGDELISPSYYLVAG